MHNHCRGKTRTFKPRKDVPEGTKQYQLRKYAEATLVRVITLWLAVTAPGLSSTEPLCRDLGTSALRCASPRVKT